MATLNRYPSTDDEDEDDFLEYTDSTASSMIQDDIVGEDDPQTRSLYSQLLTNDFTTTTTTNDNDDDAGNETLMDYTEFADKMTRYADTTNLYPVVQNDDVLTTTSPTGTTTNDNVVGSYPKIESQSQEEEEEAKEEEEDEEKDEEKELALIEGDDDSFWVIDRDATGDLVYKTEKECDELYNVCTSSTSFKTFEHLFQFNNETQDLYDEEFFHTLCTCQAQAPYLNGLLLNEQDLLQKFKIAEFNGESSTDNGDRNSFYEVMKQYYDTVMKKAIPTLQQCNSNISDIQKKTDDPNDYFYSFSTKSITSPACYCEDKRRLTKDVQITVATLEKDRLDSVRDDLKKARDFYYNEQCSAECAFTCCQLVVNFHVQTTVARRDNISLRQYISILFSFERMSHLNEYQDEIYMTRFRNHVRMSIRKCVTTLLNNSSDVDDNRLIIFNVVQTQFISQWGAEFIQISNMVNDQCVDVFLAELSMFLTPVFDLVSNELILTEEDYIKLWEQIPFFDFVDYLVVKSKSLDGSNFTEWGVTFAVLETTLYILSNALQTFNIGSHKNFARRIGHTIVRYVQICTCILFDDSLSSSYDNTGQSLIQGLYDNFFVKSFYSLWRTNVELGLWSFLIQFPYGHLSQYTIAALFYNVLTINMENFENIKFSSMSSFKDWNEFVKNSSLRIHFAKQIADLENKNRASSPWFYAIPVVATLASYSTSINFAAIIVQELFLVAFINQETRQLYYRDVCTAISTICARHVNILSMLVTLIDEFSKKDQQHKAFIHLFKSCHQQIRMWEPSISDTQILSEWLQQPLDSVMFRVGTLIIENLGWSRDKTDQFTISSEIQKNICLSVIEALDFHTKKNQPGGWLRGGYTGNMVSFEDFCVKILLQAKLQTSVGVPCINFESFTHPSLNITYQNSCRVLSELNVLTILSCYLLLLLSEECCDFYKLKTETNVLYCIEQAIQENPSLGLRFLIEVGSKFCCSDSDVYDEQLTKFIMTINQQDTRSSYIGATLSSVMSMKNVVGQATKKFVGSIIKLMNSEYDHLHLSLFWIRQIATIPKWYDDDCCTYFVDQICMNLVLKNMIMEDIGSTIISSAPNWCIEEKAPTEFYYPFGYIFEGRDKFFPKGIFDRLTFSKERPYLTLMFSFAKIQQERVLRSRIYDSLHKSSSASMPFIHYSMDKKRDILLQTLQSIDTGIQPHDFCIYRVLVYAVRYSRDVISIDKKNEARKKFIHTYVQTCLPLLWQLFFSLYFEPYQVGQEQLFFGPSFLGFDSEEMFQERLSNLLRELSTCYVKESLKEEEKASDKRNQIPSKLAALYHSMSNWVSPKMEFFRLHDQITRLSRGYDTVRLVSLINQANVWYDMVDYDRFNDVEIPSLDDIFPSTGITSTTSSPDIKILDLESLKKQERSYIRNPPAFDSNIVEVRTTIGFDLKQILSEMKSVSKQYYTMSDSSQTLDDQYINAVPQLIRNTESTLNLKLTCTPSILCKGAGVVQFPVVSMEKSDTVLNSLRANRIRWQNGMQVTSMAHLRDIVCATIVDVGATISFMVERDQREECVDIFFQLLSNFEYIVRKFPPIRDPLYFHLLKPIADSFIKKSSDYTRNLLVIILKENTQIRAKWFADLFDPICCHNEWSDLMGILASYHKEDGGFQKILPLILKFDYKKWLQLHQDTNEQQVRDIMKLCFDVCSQKGSLIRSTEEQQVFTFFMKFLSEIVLSNREKQLYYDLLSLTLELLTLKTNTSIGAIDLLNLLTVCYSNISLNFTQLEAIVKLFGVTLATVRGSSNKTMYESLSTVLLKSMIRLMTATLKSTVVLVNNAQSVHSFFGLLCEAFKYFIFIESNRYPFNGATSEVSVALQAFVSVLNHVSTPLIQNELWVLFRGFRTMGATSEYINIFSAALFESDWEMFQLIGLDQIVDMISILRSSTASIVEKDLICHIVSQIQWSKLTTFTTIDISDEHGIQQFYQSVAILFAHVIVTNNKERNKNIMQHIPLLQWAEYVTVESFNVILKEYFALFMVFNIKMMENGQLALDSLFQILQRFVQRNGISFRDFGWQEDRVEILIDYMRYLLHLFSLILQKRDQDGELYIYLDHNKDGLYQYCVDLVLQQPYHAKLLGELSKVFNVCQIQLPAFSSLIQLVLRLVMQQSDTQLCLELLAHGCKMVGISDQLAILSEACIRVIVTGDGLYAMLANTKWNSIIDSLHFGEAAQDNFVISCIKQGCVCSLYAIAQKDLILRGDSFNTANLVNSWIRRVDMLHKNQTILMSLQQQTFKIQAQDHQDDYFALLLKLYLDLMEREVSQRFKKHDMIGLVEKLTKIYTSSSQSTFSALYGHVSKWFSSKEEADSHLKKYSQHSNKMQWLCAMLALFLMRKLSNSPHILTEPVGEDVKWVMTAPQLLKALSDIAKRSGGVSEAVSITKLYTDDETKKLTDATKLFDQIYNFLLSE